METSSPSAWVAPEMPRVSVVIASYNRCAMLGRVLNALARQTVPDGTYEVLVVADGCTDDTVSMCRQLAGKMPYPLRVIEQANAGPSEARNRGVREARGSLVIFLDDDLVPDPGLIGVHLAVHALDGSDSTVALGPALPPRDIRLNAWGAWEERKLLDEYRTMEANGNSATFHQFYTGNASLARYHVLESGGFDPRFRRIEDVELGHRLEARGCAFIFVPDARGWHYTNHSFTNWIGRAQARGRADAELGRLYGIADLIDCVRAYHHRNAVVRLFLRACLGSPKMVAFVTRTLHMCAVVGGASHATVVADASCSVLCNLHYFDALASAIGGRRRFFQIVRAPRPTLTARSEPAPATPSTEHAIG